MSDFLESLKTGMQEAQQKFAAAQQKLATTQAEFQSIQQKFSAAQNEFNSAAQEFQAFQTLVAVQTRKQQIASGATSPTGTTTPPPAPVLGAARVQPSIRMNAAVLGRPVPRMPSPDIRNGTPLPSQPQPQVQVQSEPVQSQPQPQQAPVETNHMEIEQPKSEITKTEAVRELLRLHPEGLTPSEMWKHLQTKISNRTYLYSVLKRLRDKGDARERRNKYFLSPKPVVIPQTSLQ